MYKALEVQRQMDNQGNLLMGTPPHLNIQELAHSVSVRDRSAWSEHKVIPVPQKAMKLDLD